MGYKKKILVTVIATVAVMALSAPIFAQDPGPDNVPPSDVENVKTAPGDTEVALSWDVATDNNAVAGYKIFYGTSSVSVEGQEYNLGFISVEDVVTYTVKNLRNGIPYYFAIVAVDASGNESANYSLEVSATPDVGLSPVNMEDDGNSPAVLKAEALTSEKIRVTFSEPVALPLESPAHSFSIKKKKDKSALNVVSVEIDPEEESNAIFLVITAPQSEEPYILTVDQLVTDFYGNSIVRDENDKVEFNGFATAKKTAQAGTPDTSPANSEERPSAMEDTKPPLVIKTEAEASNRVKIEFSEPINAPENLPDGFIIHEKNDPEKTLKVLSGNLSVDKTLVYLVTDPQEEKDYIVEFNGISDMSGNAVDVKVFETDSSPAVFKGIKGSLLDLIAPEDITNLMAKIVDPRKSEVTLTWEASKNSAGDLNEQLLYQSLDRGKNYDGGKSLGPNANSAEIKNLKGGSEYTWKVTVKDFSGNESEGRTITLKLPETGPAFGIALILALSSGYISRKRKAKH